VHQSITLTQSQTTIRELRLSACGIDAATTAVFGKILGKSKRIRTLDLSWNNIGRTGAHSLASVLSRGCKVRKRKD
jgi:hypothetical protein